jgi:hypothetical protein
MPLGENKKRKTMKSKKTSNGHLLLTEKQTEKLGKILAKALSKYGLRQKDFKTFDVKRGIEILEEIARMRKELESKHKAVAQKCRKDFEYWKKWHLNHAKKGKKALGEMLKILSKFDSYQVQGLCDFVKSLRPRVDYGHLYKRMKAEGNASWGSPSYIVTNVLNGTKQELVSKNSKAYKVMSAAVNNAKKAVADQKPGNRLLGLDGVVSVKDGDHYIAFVTGGNNGCSDWATYFKSLITIVNSVKKGWLIEIENDCCDDVHYALIGFRI